MFWPRRRDPAAASLQEGRQGVFEHTQPRSPTPGNKDDKHQASTRRKYGPPTGPVKARLALRATGTGPTGGAGRAETKARSTSRLSSRRGGEFRLKTASSPCRTQHGRPAATGRQNRGGEGWRNHANLDELGSLRDRRVGGR